MNKLTANELRLGNFIRYNEVFEGVFMEPNEGQLTADDMVFIFESDLLETAEPIPLTAEWLERAGFEREAETVWRHKNSQHVYETTINEYVYRVPGTSLTIIKYVHQLQNLYFALTNQELDFTKK